MTDVNALIEKMRPEPASIPQFLAARYPFTYAYDFARSHAAILLANCGVDQDLLLGPDTSTTFWSRAETSGIVRRYVEATGQDREQVIVALADAYLDEHGYQVSKTERALALRDARDTSWKSLGYDEKPVAS